MDLSAIFLRFKYSGPAVAGMFALFMAAVVIVLLRVETSELSASAVWLVPLAAAMCLVTSLMIIRNQSNPRR